MTQTIEPTTVVRDFTLAELEEVIESGLMTFVEVGQALMRIRDGKLYRNQYATFQAYCTARWGFDRTYAHRLVKAAEISEMLPIGNKPANEAQARALKPLQADPPKMLEAMAEAREETGGRPTTAAIERAVEKRAAPKPSVRSERDAADSQEIPDDQALGCADAPAFEVSNEPADRRRDHFCSDCGGHYRGDACPCTAQGVPGQEDEQAPWQAEAAAVSKMLGDILDDDAQTTTEADGADPADDLPADADRRDAALAGDERGSETPAPGSDPAPARADSSRAGSVAAYQPAVRTGSAGLGSKPAATTHPFATPRIDAGDLTRALLDLPIGQVIEALAENADPAQKRAIRDALGGPVPPPPARPEPAAPLDLTGRTVLDIVTAIRAAVPAAARPSLVGLLVDDDEIAADRWLPLRHRVDVKIRKHNEDARPEAVRDAVQQAVAGAAR